MLFSIKEPNHIHTPGKGLPAGLELVYLLASNMFHEIDTRMRRITSGQFARYIDDMLFFGPDRSSLENWMTELQTDLADMGLQLNHTKTFVQSTEEPLRFLREDL